AEGIAGREIVSLVPADVLIAARRHRAGAARQERQLRRLRRVLRCGRGEARRGRAAFAAARHPSGTSRTGKNREMSEMAKRVGLAIDAAPKPTVRYNKGRADGAVYEVIIADEGRPIDDGNPKVIGAYADLDQADD